MLQRVEKVSDALEVQELRSSGSCARSRNSRDSFDRSNDRIAYSTITIQFQPASRPDIDDSDVLRLALSPARRDRSAQPAGACAMITKSKVAMLAVAGPALFAGCHGASFQTPGNFAKLEQNERYEQRATNPSGV